MTESNNFQSIIRIFENNNINYFLCGSRFFKCNKETDDWDILVYSNNYEKLFLILEMFGFKKIDNSILIMDDIHIFIIHKEKLFKKKVKYHKQLFKKYGNLMQK